MSRRRSARGRQKRYSSSDGWSAELGSGGGRKCEGGAVNGSGRESVHDTNLRSVGCAEPLSGGAHNSLRVPRQDPPLLPSIIYILRPHVCTPVTATERVPASARITPRGQQAGA